MIGCLNTDAVLSAIPYMRLLGDMTFVNIAPKDIRSWPHTMTTRPLCAACKRPIAFGYARWYGAAEEEVWHRECFDPVPTSAPLPF